MAEHRVLNQLGSDRFEVLVQTLLKCVIGDGTTTFGPGKDGAREATFSGEAPYPSTQDPWAGEWIFQAKFHDTDLVGVGKARTQVLSEVSSELRRINKTYKHDCDNYILVTNVPLSGVAGTGTHDQFRQRVKSADRGNVENIQLWGAADVIRLLLKYPQVRRAFPELTITGDLLDALIRMLDRDLDELQLSIKLYLAGCYAQEQNAMLDQAGDVTEEVIRLPQVFLELNSLMAEYGRGGTAEQAAREFMELARESNLDPHRRVAPTVRFLLSDCSAKTVLVGGPGEGKSTVGQYLTQVHRATLLDRVDDVAIDRNYIPTVPRLPFRIILRDFAAWLSRPGGSRGEQMDSLEHFIIEHIESVAARTVSLNELHRVFRENPILLVLDGLDEVTEPEQRSRLTSKLSEFMDRSDQVLKADMQVLGSTRPIGYGGQFDRRDFLHLHLTKLNDAQVLTYTNKWMVAKKLDSAKSARIADTVRECLADNQVKLLMTTPLQVTILLLIISAGGTPPRQREALFNEYLEVIYKRETAKGRSVITTEKELLIGLHKYVGYLLHEEATVAAGASSTLPRPDYEREVAKFLDNKDPYSPSAERNAAARCITRESGERLVLIVESPADHFGFELRSIQEFFAASYMCDTAAETGQRYARFEAISLLPHWRNVVLFFAGRIGRTYPGEAVGLVELCRQIDRRKPDTHLRRGCSLALGLAVDRAFGPERRLQHGLIEYGTELLSLPSLEYQRDQVIEDLQKLPDVDQRDLAIPILQSRQPHTLPEHALGLVYALGALNGLNHESLRVLRQLLASDNPDHTIQAVQATLRLPLEADTGDELLGLALTGPHAEDVLTQLWDWRAAQRLTVAATASGVADSAKVQILTGALRIWFVSMGGVKLTDESVKSRAPRDEFLFVYRALEALNTAASVLNGELESVELKNLLRHLRKHIEPGLQDVLSGNVTEFLHRLGVDSRAEVALPLWLAHLVLGDVTAESLEAFEVAMTQDRQYASLGYTWEYAAKRLSPALEFYDLAMASGRSSDLKSARDFALARLGLEHISSTPELRRALHVQARLKSTPSDPRQDRITLAELAGLLTIPADQVVLEYLVMAYRTWHISEMPLVVELFVDESQNLPVRLEALRGLVSFDLRDQQVGELVGALGQLVHDKPNIPTQAAEMATAFFAREDVFIYLNTETAEPILEWLGRRRNQVAWMSRRQYGPSMDTRYFRHLLRLLTEVTSDEARLGVLSLLEGLIRDRFRRVTNEGYMPARPKGIVGLHRQVLASENPILRHCAHLFFAFRPPTTSGDWQAIRSWLPSEEAQQVGLLTNVLTLASHEPGSHDAWVAFLTELLEDHEDEGLREVVEAVLRHLLLRGDQSLRTLQTSLGLLLGSATTS